ncbi:hypothetical protein MLV53_20765, partial [Escherichia coli]|nr:hypothetical protein [Escherichia coli]MCN3173424.1 hypothetical protein [Escherichia coli]
PAKPNGLTGHDHADLRRRMPQLARAPASLRRPGALQQGGALYCACERQRATGATTHQAKSHPEKLPCNIHTM